MLWTHCIDVSTSLLLNLTFFIRSPRTWSRSCSRIKIIIYSNINSSKKNKKLQIERDSNIGCLILKPSTLTADTMHDLIYLIHDLIYLLHYLPKNSKINY